MDWGREEDGVVNESGGRKEVERFRALSLIEVEMAAGERESEGVE